MHQSGEPARLEVSAALADSRGRACPQPIIDLARALRAHELVELWADDPAARGDLVAFAEATGHGLERLEPGPPLRALVRRKARAGSPPPHR
jgi:tRNA 2-thiouridine synthesizing protein A